MVATGVCYLKGPKDHVTPTVLSFDLCLCRFSVQEISLFFPQFRGFVSLVDVLHFFVTGLNWLFFTFSLFGAF